jgi:hypothetical protein
MSSGGESTGYGRAAMSLMVAGGPSDLLTKLGRESRLRSAGCNSPVAGLSLFSVYIQAPVEI